MEKIVDARIPPDGLDAILWESYPNSREFLKAVSAQTSLKKDDRQELLQITELYEYEFTTRSMDYFRSEGLSIPYETFLARLDGRTFQHKWEIRDALGEISEEFRYREGDEKWNTQLDERFSHLFIQLKE